MAFPNNTTWPRELQNEAAIFDQRMAVKSAIFATITGHTVQSPQWSWRSAVHAVHAGDDEPILRIFVRISSALALFAGYAMPTPSSLLLSLTFSSEEAVLGFINGQ